MTTYSTPNYIKHLDDVIKKLETEVAQVLEIKWGKDMVGRIQKRVDTDRKTATGGTFSPYNPSYLKWKQDKKEFIGNKKNFTLTGNMWKGFGVTNSDKTGQTFSVDLKGRDTDSQDKIEWNTKFEERSIIEASKEEEKKQQDFFNEWLNEFLAREL